VVRASGPPRAASAASDKVDKAAELAAAAAAAAARVDPGPVGAAAAEAGLSPSKLSVSVLLSGFGKSPILTRSLCWCCWLCGAESGG